MRILIAAVAPWCGTGYGTQADALARRLRADGHEIGWLALAGFSGQAKEIDGYTFLPQSVTEVRGNETVQSHAEAFDADFVLSIADAWILHDYGGDRFRWLSWFPIDGEPLSPDNRKVLPRMWRRACMSRFGTSLVTDAGFDCAYVPLGFEREKYYPDPKAGRAMREAMGVAPETFVFGTVGMNIYPDRKGFDRLLEAWARFSEGKDDVLLYMHTSPIPNESLDLNRLCDELGIGDTVRFPRPYSYLIGYTQDAMRGVYNMIDCYVQPTRGEGFGVPVLEALACGVPVIATDCTSMTELVHDTVNGTLVPVESRLLNAGYYYWSLISVTELVKAMEDMYAKHQYVPHGDVGGAAGEYHAARFPNIKRICELTAKTYEWDVLYGTYWRPMLADIEEELYPKKRAVIVVGPESSGTRLVTGIFTKAGFAGSDGHDQPWDHKDPDGRLVVYRQSIPHNHQWPDFEALAGRFRRLGYEVAFVATDRDDAAMMASQVNAGHVTTRTQAWENIKRARQHIADGLKVAQAPVARVQYERLVADPRGVIERLLARYRVPLPEVEVYDGNAKWKERVDEAVAV